jgi:hypothetical protein
LRRQVKVWERHAGDLCVLLMESTTSSAIDLQGHAAGGEVLRCLA